MPYQKKTSSENPKNREYQRVTVLLNDRCRKIIKMASAIRGEQQHKTIEWVLETYLLPYIKENLPD